MEMTIQSDRIPSNLICVNALYQPLVYLALSASEGGVFLVGNTRYRKFNVLP